MTQAVPLRNSAKKLFVFLLVTQRHFSKVLNSIDFGIAGDRLESNLLQPEGLCTFPKVFTLHCPFAANQWTWAVNTSVVPSGWFAGVFLFSVTVSCSFPSRSLGFVFVLCDTWTLLDDVDQFVNSVRTFHCLTVTNVSEHGPEHADT